MTLKMFVWEGVLTDYTMGMVCVVANELEEAFEKIYEKDKIAWSVLQGLWEEKPWGDSEIEALKGDLCERQYQWMKDKGLKVYPSHINPKVITKPEAFVVHGGG